MIWPPGRVIWIGWRPGRRPSRAAADAVAAQDCTRPGCARGEASESSDLDLLVDLELGRDLLDLVALKQDIEGLLGCRVDVVEEPSIDAARVWFCSDEHVTFAADDQDSSPRALRVGDRIRVWPAHVDPTVAYHAAIRVVRGDDVIDTWPVDLRGW